MSFSSSRCFTCYQPRNMQAIAKKKKKKINKYLKLLLVFPLSYRQSREAVDAPILDVLKASLYGTLGHLI